MTKDVFTNMESKIKTATKDDLKTIQELNRILFEKESAEFDNTLDCKWTFSTEGESYFNKRIVEDDGCIFVAYVDDKIVGYLAGGLVKNKTYRSVSNFADLENMFVLEEYRGMEIGTRLYETFVEWCKSKVVRRLQVVTSAQNTGGINFYKKNGFINYDLVLESILP